MRARYVTTAVTLVVLIGILTVAALLGVRALTAPLPEATTKPSTSAGTPGCASRALRKGQQVSSSQVEVSVYNAGTRSGLADSTMAALTDRGFATGSVGNAPEGSKVKVVQVWTTRRNDVAARLVALQFGKKAKVFRKRTDLGPGIDVVVGDGLGSLADAKRAVTVRRSQSICLPSRTAGG